MEKLDNDCYYNCHNCPVPSCLQRWRQPCVRSEQRPGPPGAGQSGPDPPRHPEDHVLCLSSTSPPFKTLPAIITTRRQHTTTHARIASGALLTNKKGARPKPLLRLRQSGPDTVQRKAGRRDPDTEDAIAALKITKTTRQKLKHYYAISNQPTRSFPDPYQPLSVPLLSVFPICLWLSGASFFICLFLHSFLPNVCSAVWHSLFRVN